MVPSLTIVKIFSLGRQSLPKMRSKRWTTWHSYITPSLLNPSHPGQSRFFKEDHVLALMGQRLSLGYDTIIFPDYHKCKNSSSLVLVSNTAAVALYPKNHPLAVPGLIIRVFPTFLF